MIYELDRVNIFKRLLYVANTSKFLDEWVVTIFSLNRIRNYYAILPY